MGHGALKRTQSVFKVLVIKYVRVVLAFNLGDPVACQLRFM